MFRKTKLVIMIWVLSAGACLFLWSGSPAGAYQEGDWQLWSTNALEGSISQNWKISFEEQFRFGDDISELYYHQAGLGLAWKMTEWFQTGLTYAQVYELKKGQWKEEARPLMDGTVQKKWKALSLSDRNRFERRMRQDALDLWRYRNNLTVSPAHKWGTLQIQPYMSGEAFVDLVDEGDFNQCRLIGGLKGRLARYLQADLYYLRQLKEKNGEWNSDHILGLKVKVSP
jgi:hypothetical protein